MTPPRRPEDWPPYNFRQASATLRGVEDAAPYNPTQTYNIILKDYLMKIAIISLGCPKNQVDADVFCHALIKDGHTGKTTVVD